MKLNPPSLDDWPDITYSPDNGIRVNVNEISKADVAQWKTGDVLLLNGKIYTAAMPPTNTW